jgi:hypothetical protein
MCGSGGADGSFGAGNGPGAGSGSRCGAGPGSAGEVVGDEVVGDEVVGDEVVGDEVVGDEVVGDEVVGDEVVGDEVVDDDGGCTLDGVTPSAAGRPPAPADAASARASSCVEGAVGVVVRAVVEEEAGAVLPAADDIGPNATIAAAAVATTTIDLPVMLIRPSPTSRRTALRRRWSRTACTTRAGPCSGSL